MEKMKTFLIALLGAIMMLFSLSSCTDKYDVEIETTQSVKVTAAHIFDNYEQFQEGDFDMGADGWKLNLQVLVYDENGILVDKKEKLCESLSETLEYMPSLREGVYTVISIADFREGLGGKGYKFWNITNDMSLQDISITENENIYPVVFETLGVDIQKLVVSDKTLTVNADIKPVTSLVQVFMSDKDYSSWGIDGYSRYSVLCEGYFIKAIKFKNNIRIENGELSYKYSEQVSDYNIAISHVYEKWSDKKAPTGYNYRALLPEDNKGFSFRIQKRDLPQDYYDVAVQLCGEFDTEGKSNILPRIESNKQYVVNMILDAMQLVAMELPSDFTHEAYTKQYVSDYNMRLMEKMVDIKYENILGKDEAYANVFLDDEPYEHSGNKIPYIAYYKRSRADHFEQFVTTAYVNADYTNCLEVNLLLPDLSDELFSYLKTILGNKYVPEEEGKFGPNVWSYGEPRNCDEESRSRVVLQKEYNKAMDKDVYFLKYVLREKYY